MIDERVILTKEQAENLIPEGEYIHTFRQAGFALIGADWDRKDILESFSKYPPELSGEQATAMKHGICFCDPNGYVFVATK